MEIHEPYVKTKVSNFGYTEQGVTGFASHSEDITRTFFELKDKSLFDEVHEMPEYSNSLASLKTILGDESAPKALNWLIQEVVYTHLHPSRFFDLGSGELLQTLFKRLKGEPIRYYAQVSLEGVVLVPKNIILEDGIVLRKKSERGF